MDILFVRHGQPQWAVDGLSQIDPHLTELGRKQAELAAHRIATDPKATAAELIASPATRSQETALPVARETKLPIETIDGLLEIQMPDWRGVTEEVVIDIFKTTRHRSPDEWWDGLPGGESFRDFHDRVTTSLDALLAKRGITKNVEDPRLWDIANDPGRIVIVAHGGTNSVCLAHLMGAPPSPWEWEKYVLFHASFARVKFIPLAGAHVSSLRTFNDQDHIPPELRSR
jgi:broad specificity phosphatase PhoE